MENLSFNNINNDVCSLYFLKNFMNDFMEPNKSLFHESKSQEQKDFEKYLIEKKIILIDYARVIKSQKYFNILTSYINSTDKKTILYSCKNLSYISPSCIFYKYDIPKKSTIRNFENIYNYLIVHQDKDRICFCCNENETPFFYCTSCGKYYCKKCIYENLKVMTLKDLDIYYIICRFCDSYHTLYKIPSHHTPL